MISAAKKNPQLAKIIHEAELVIPDGIGVEIGLRILGHNVRRVAGIDFAREVLNSGKTAALVGAAPHVVKKAVQNLHKPELNTAFTDGAVNIIYHHDGFFQDAEPIKEELRRLQPQILLAALGSPKQEEFIYSLKEILPNTLMLGVGGSFDVWAGEVARAPEIWQKLGLEWLYRTIKEPKRFKRIFPVLPLFVISVIMEKMKSAFLQRGRGWRNDVKQK
jgi:N-acetylglucosaminyldiphosphoundecaprenol N-acetyl-beta-D-mannosaminyltransferase